MGDVGDGSLSQPHHFIHTQSVSQSASLASLAVDPALALEAPDALRSCQLWGVNVNSPH